MTMTKLFKEFFDSEKAGGFVLLACTILSLVIANSSFGDTYDHFWHSHLDLSFASVDLNYTVEHWINDGLMTVFFLLVGLEIERELYKGELSNFRNAILPIGAAVGGMLVPAGIYLLVNLNAADRSGYGIPMATDIAFALGMLALAGSRVPFSLKIFLTALAIIDDLGAILVIAIFYNTGISPGFLGASLAIFIFLMVLNKLGVKNLLFYLVPGAVMWYCMLQSGVHATITGVLLAFAIPFSKNDATNPSYLLQHALHKPVAFVLLPVFALANTGIVLPAGWLKEVGSANSLGIIAGLVIGKPVGIVLACCVLLKMKVAALPQNVSRRHLAGAGVLAGIGFTMSIFISNLAFTDAARIQFSKIAVLIASLLATILGLSTLLRSPGTVERPSTYQG
jgi:Na+:H+ antiporter, NhaA family